MRSTLRDNYRVPVRGEHRFTSYLRGTTWGAMWECDNRTLSLRGDLGAAPDMAWSPELIAYAIADARTVLAELERMERQQGQHEQAR